MSGKHETEAETKDAEWAKNLPPAKYIGSTENGAQYQIKPLTTEELAQATALPADALESGRQQLTPDFYQTLMKHRELLNIDNGFKAEGIPLRRFYLNRLKDETGVSRTGRVLEGVLTQSGNVFVEWRPPHSTIGIYNSYQEFRTIHVDCHPSCNEVVWLDEIPKDEMTAMVQRVTESAAQYVDYFFPRSETGDGLMQPANSFISDVRSLQKAQREMPYESKPIDMVLHCPRCGMQHIDEPNPAKNWDNPPHRSHECQYCGHIFRPADVETNGVLAIKTKGKNDSPTREALQ